MVAKRFPAEESDGSPPVRGKSTGVFVERPHRPGKAQLIMDQMSRDEQSCFNKFQKCRCFVSSREGLYSCYVRRVGPLRKLDVGFSFPLCRSSSCVIYDPAKMCHVQVALMNMALRPVWWPTGVD